jgi:hypothetical protein
MTGAAPMIWRSRTERPTWPSRAARHCAGACGAIPAWPKRRGDFAISVPSVRALRAIGRVRPEDCQLGHRSPKLRAAHAITESIRFPDDFTAHFARVRASRLTDSNRLTLRIFRSHAARRCCKLFRKWQLRRLGLDRNLLHHQRSRV